MEVVQNLDSNLLNKDSFMYYFYNMCKLISCKILSYNIKHEKKSSYVVRGK